MSRSLMVRSLVTRHTAQCRVLTFSAEIGSVGNIIQLRIHDQIQGYTIRHLCEPLQSSMVCMCGTIWHLNDPVYMHTSESHQTPAFTTASTMVSVSRTRLLQKIFHGTSRVVCRGLMTSHGVSVSQATDLLTHTYNNYHEGCDP